MPKADNGIKFNYAGTVSLPFNDNKANFLVSD